MPTLQDLIADLGPALPPRLAVEVARGVLASLDPGPFDTPPADRLDPVEVNIRAGASGAVLVAFGGAARLAAVGELLYVMLAGGPIRLPKDPPASPPRPLAKLRRFLGGGPLPPGLEGYVASLLAERFADAEEALAALESLEVV